jgi:XTP/dITP diphosphohydrolase
MPEPTLLLATRSPDKLREIRQILAPLGLEIVSLNDVDIPPDPAEDAIEAFLTFRENALAKARHFAALTGRLTLADDSGLEVEALGGAPGVFTKRFSGRADLRGRALDEANNELLLQKLAGIPVEGRSARYVCAAAAARPDGATLVGLGTTPGRIAERPSAGTHGFGYDPLFFVPELHATFADVPAGEKHRRSHRARAFRALASSIASLR